MTYKTKMERLIGELASGFLPVEDFEKQFDQAHEGYLSFRQDLEKWKEDTNNFKDLQENIYRWQLLAGIIKG